MTTTLRNITTTACTLALVTSCARTTTAPSDSAGLTLGNGRPAVRLTNNPQHFPHHAYEFRDMRLAGDTLAVTVRYGGGCVQNHEFALLVTPTFLESYPVQMHGSLAHDSKGDPCRALIESTLTLDLTPLKQAYRSAYQTTSGAITLHVRDWPRSVEYRF